MIENPFWIFKIKSLNKLWQSGLVLHSDVIMETPPWFNPMLRIVFKCKWFSEGIIVVGEV